MRRSAFILAVSVALVHGVTMIDEAAVNIGDATETLSTARHVTYRFQHGTEEGGNLGESATVPGTLDEPGPDHLRAQMMVQFGTLLTTLDQRQKSAHGSSVTALTQALQTKVIMDQLHRNTNSLAKNEAESDLGESHKSTLHKSFLHLLHSPKKNMAEITKYLLERKKEGDPLTTKEDSQLQKYYYNRASTILKKIVLLKKGEEPPVNDNDSDDEQSEADESKSDEEAEADAEKADVVVERLKFDAKVANANAAYNKKMMQAQQRRSKAAELRHRQAAKNSLKATEQKLAYDEKVANAEAKYNEALSQELEQKKNDAEGRVKKAEKEKVAADKASAKATSDAEEADKEAAKAVKEAEEASARAKRLQAEDGSDEAKKHRLRAHRTHVHKPVIIPLSVSPHAKLQSLLRYLQTALDKHQTITPAEQQLMQSFFLKHGSALLSKLAQVDPDATWHSKGVVREEQYEMDRKRPNRVSQEWGSKNLKGATVVKDFMQDVLSTRQSKTALKRPAPDYHAEGLFGSNFKLPLRFAADTSAPMKKEPSMELGEDDSVQQTPQKAAWSGLMGISEDD